MTGPGHRRVEVVLDVVCVQAYVGFTRYARAAERYRAAGGTVETVLLPYQLRPEAPAEGEPLIGLHRRERGEEAARALAPGHGFGVAEGLQLHFHRALFTNSFAAHRMLARASAQGRGELAAGRLFRAYFADGLHIGDPAVLSRLAAETGVTAHGTVDDAQLRAELARVRRLGVGLPLPALRFGTGHVLGGEQSESALLAALAG